RLGSGTKPMIRRDVIKFIIASLASYPLVAMAQRSIPVIGALSPSPRPAQFDSTIYDGFLQGMRELGYVGSMRTTRPRTALPQVLDILRETSQDRLLWGRKSSRNLWNSYGLFF